MRTGYRAPNGTQVVAAFPTSANFMFHIYRGLLHPYGALIEIVRPALHSLPPLPLPCRPLPAFSSSRSCAALPCGTCPVGDHFFLALEHHTLFALLYLV